MDHPLENLDPERFQLLAQALIVSEYPGAICFPVGQPDGGRDSIQHVHDERGEASIVFQVKFSREARSGKGAVEWLLAAVNKELPKIKKLEEHGAKSYVLVTNVAGTAHLDIGSIDTLHTELTALVGIPAICWWRNDINRRLDSNWDLKLRYPEVLSGQDFLRLLIQGTSGENIERRLNAVRAFLAEQYAEDQDVKFKQVELQNKLLDLFVDLPFRLHFEAGIDLTRISSLFQVRARSTENGRMLLDDDSGEGEGGGTASLLLAEVVPELLQIVVEGAPGQGKSTLVQYICQVHRIRLLGKQEDLRLLPDSHRNAPVFLPIKVDLRDLSDWLSAGSSNMSKGGERSVENFLANLVSQKSGGMEFSVHDLISVGKIAPLLLALDGLDEVADIRRRAEVVSAISKSLPRLRENSRGMRVIITSRPAAFANSPGFDRKHYPFLQLGSVTRAQINKYSAKWMNARTLTKKERAEFVQVLDEKLSLPHLRDLSRNPMQLTILLSLVHTKGSALPDKRTALYDAYVDLFFSRESTKNPVVRKHLELLKDIHRYLAWMLHCAAESGRSEAAAGRFTSEQLRAHLSEYLKRELLSTDVIDEVFNAMLERVVMIVSRVEGTHEFEVQPLREYFAARYLYDTASYSPAGGERTGTKPDRFDAIARNSYWLNVTRFFCGCFSKGELLDLADRLKLLFADQNLKNTRHAHLLAGMLLGDWVFSQSQRSISELVPALSSPSALRRLVPEYFGDEDSIRIPMACGGQEICEAAIGLSLRANTPSDLAFRLANLVRINMKAEDILPRWCDARPRRTEHISRWIIRGGQLGCLSLADAGLIEDIVISQSLSVDAVDALLAAERISSIAAVTRHEEALRKLIKNSIQYFDADQSNFGKSPLFLVPALLGNLAMLSVGYYAQADQQTLMQALQEFAAQSEILPHASENISHKCYRASHAIASRLPIEPSEHVQFWEQTIEDLRSEFGVCASVVACGLGIALLPKGKRGRPPRHDMFSDSSLCDQIRYAKSKASSSEWWSVCFDKATSTEDRFYVNYTFWLLAPGSTILENARLVSDKLEELSTDEWANLSSFLHRHEAYSMRRKPVIGFLIKELRPFNFSASKRFLILLARRLTTATAQELFLEHFIDTQETDQTTAFFRQASALSAALQEKLPWPKALEIIRATHGMEVSYGVSSRQQLPVAIAEHIVATPEDYPARLWDSAATTLATIARKAIRPVGEQAEREKWFSQL